MLTLSQPANRLPAAAASRTAYRVIWGRSFSGPSTGYEPGPPFIRYDEWASYPVAIIKRPRLRSFQAESHKWP
jgi:hypothetical protein